tara:strand:+ start:30540 stop:31343 length:804 start_codon:yes stop_codon:yes gene_type:complete
LLPVAKPTSIQTQIAGPLAKPIASAAAKRAAAVNPTALAGVTMPAKATAIAATTKLLFAMLQSPLFVAAGLATPVQPTSFARSPQHKSAAGLMQAAFALHAQKHAFKPLTLFVVVTAKLTATAVWQRHRVLAFQRKAPVKHNQSSVVALETSPVPTALSVSMIQTIAVTQATVVPTVVAFAKPQKSVSLCSANFSVQTVLRLTKTAAKFVHAPTQSAQSIAARAAVVTKAQAAAAGAMMPVKATAIAAATSTSFAASPSAFLPLAPA